jgi:hypothetical protein
VIDTIRYRVRNEKIVPSELRRYQHPVVKVIYVIKFVMTPLIGDEYMEKPLRTMTSWL